MPETAWHAAILDLDGVLTRTATLHARAWKAMFDTFIAARPAAAGEDHAPFDIATDYVQYVDGMPRFDGVRSFLRSRGITLPEGAPDDGPEQDTVRGLGTRKNAHFLALLDSEPIETFEDAVAQLHEWRAEGLGTALITSSRNGRRILAATGLADAFDVTIDGVDAERLAIRGKPSPDIFLRAAAALGVAPRDAIVVEDAISGVTAARAGGFGLVVGVARNGGDGLRDAGADIVVSDLREVSAAAGRRPARPDPARPDPARPDVARPSALEQIERLTDRLDTQRLVLFLDYDGTLTPIVPRPEDATLGAAMEKLLRELASRVTVGIISGRDLDDVRAMVGLDELYYAGSHGFDVAGPGGMRMQQPAALDHLPELDAAERAIAQRLEEVDGAWVERKLFAIAVHFREVADAEAHRVERAVDAVLGAQPRLRKRGGKKIFELQPDVPWHKGYAVRWLLEQLGLDGPDVLPVYVGDDVTDEDAFEALAGNGVGIRVGAAGEPTHAHFVLRDTDELQHFLERLVERLDRAAATR